MQRHIDERKCDFCQKVVQQSAMQFGGSPFSGWFRVEKTDGSTKIPRPDVGPWDFCCVNCCMNFLSGKPIPEGNKHDQ